MIDELPPGRTPVRTVVRRDADRSASIGSFARRWRAAGVQRSCSPASRRGRLRSARRSPPARSSAVAAFPDLGVGLLHGGLDAPARAEALRSFAAGAAPILVSTTVVEVGVDVPEASVIVVEQADRFGLSQLHQMRGRVGRGSRPSWCILIPAERVAASPRAHRFCRR